MASYDKANPRKQYFDNPFFKPDFIREFPEMPKYQNISIITSPILNNYILAAIIRTKKSEKYILKILINRIA